MAKFKFPYYKGHIDYEIKDELVKKGYNIDKKQIKMESINCFGYHNVNVELYKDIVAIIKVLIKKR